MNYYRFLKVYLLNFQILLFSCTDWICCLLSEHFVSKIGSAWILPRPVLSCKKGSYNLSIGACKTTAFRFSTTLQICSWKHILFFSLEKEALSTIYNQLGNWPRAKRRKMRQMNPLTAKEAINPIIRIVLNLRKKIDTWSTISSTMYSPHGKRYINS